MKPVRVPQKGGQVADSEAEAREEDQTYAKAIAVRWSETLAIT